MTDEERPDLTPAHDHGKIDQVDLQSEMQRSYLDYAMSVIVGRALPDVRDGLKPVHRRVIYGMYDGGFRPDKSFSKCARVVGEVMGQYHPHGDAADLRRPRPTGAAVVAALPARAGSGQLRLARATRAPPPRGTPRRRWPSSRSRWCATSKKTPSTSRTTTTGRPRSRRSCRRASRTCSSTAPSASRSAWRPTSRRTTCARSSAGALWALENPDASREELLEALMERIPGPDFPTRRADPRHPRHQGRVPHRSRLDHDARGRQRRRDPGPHLPRDHRAARTRSTPTTSRSRSATSRARARSPASPTSATRPRIAPVSASSSC